ncbi:MAG: hypothetical protein JSV80_08565 [Acidobacteriota bacterium]|nr:MAG: hypothetical protein JSV80_08565 [Acidobacteriota bacterium]
MSPAALLAGLAVGGASTIGVAERADTAGISAGRYNAAWAAGLTNVIVIIVVYVGIMLGAVLTIDRLGGIGGLNELLPRDHPGFDLLAVGPGLIAAWFLVMITQAHSTQSVIQVGLALRDERSASRAYLLGALLILPVGFISALIGMGAAVLPPGIIAAEALPRTVLKLSPLAAGTILAGLWAADVSTASALLMGSATLVSSDIIKRFFAPQLSAERDLVVCRWTVAALSIVTLLLALTVSGILKMLLVGQRSPPATH